MELGNDAGAPAAMDTAVVESAPEINDAAVSPDAGTGSARDSIERALAQVDAQEQGEAPTDKPATDGRKRAPDGKFAPNDPADKVVEAAKPPVEGDKPPVEANPLDEPPTRFTADAKAAWKDAPPAIKGEVKRMMSEMEGGLQRYQQAFEPLKPFHEMAVKGGTTLPDAIGRYVGMEQLLKRDLNAGLDAIVRNAGIQGGLRQYIAAMAGQPVDQQQAQADQTIHQLKTHIQQLEQRVGSVHQTIEQQRAAQEMSEAQRVIEQFSADKPRFEELKPTMGQLIQRGMAPDLQTAYSMAERLNPAPAPIQPQASTPAQAAPNLAAQTRKGSLSTTGAPSSGSNPTTRKPPSSIREALTRAAGTMGVA